MSQQMLSKYFFSGLFTLLPVFITLWLLWLLFNFVDNILGSIIEFFLGFYIPGLGLIASLLLAVFIGYLTTNVFGKKIVQIGEKILYKLPLVNFIYSSVKQLNDMVFLQKETRAFRRVCAIEWPRKGLFAIGFITGEGVAEIENNQQKKMVNVFVPNTPSPATGFIACVPENELIMLDMRLEDAVKLIVSGGVLTPPIKA